MEMTFAKAVEMIKSGDPVDYNRGYEYLYYATYNVNKWDIEKILGNEQDAEDVLQVAYIKMLETIHTLKDPEKFPAWFGKIATNKAIDVYRSRRTSKKDDGSDETYRKTISFSELEYTDGDGETVEYEWEDESLEFRPEEAYTQNETVEMVHEMLKNMPDEQKACLVMFHLQGLSIKEIAEEMQISENTVKSRLNYARKNIEAQGEELKKKGYQLYSVAPLPLLLYLLRMQRGAAAATDSYWAATAVSNWSLGAGAAAAVGEAGAVGAEAGTSVAGTVATESAGAQMAGAVSGEGAGTLGAGAVTGQGGAVSTATVTGQAGTTVASHATAQVAKTAGKKVAGGFLGTLGGKIAVIVGAIAVVLAGAIVLEKIVGDQQEVPTTEQIVIDSYEVTTLEGTTESTTVIASEEVTTQEVVTDEELSTEDQKTIYRNYLKDVLFPKYGMLSEYQENLTDDAEYDGILCSDIADYNQDGMLDLFVVYNEGTESELVNTKKYLKHFLLYTIEDGEVVLSSDYVQDKHYEMFGMRESLFYMNISIDNLYKVTVDGKIYIIFLDTLKVAEGKAYVDSYIEEICVYSFDTDKVQMIRRIRERQYVTENVNGAELPMPCYCVGEEYENGQLVNKRNLYWGAPAEEQFTTPSEDIDAEQYLSELGIECDIEVFLGSFKCGDAVGNCCLYKIWNVWGEREGATDPIYAETKQVVID